MGKLLLKFVSSCINCGKEDTMVDYNKYCADCQGCDGVCHNCSDTKCDNHSCNSESDCGFDGPCASCPQDIKDRCDYLPF